MTAVSRRYDPEMQMFADEPRELDLARLGFLRWLAEHGRLEHDPAGPSGGEYAQDLLPSKHSELRRV